MARIRTLKPSFWGDEKVADLSMSARLLLIGLISSADDEGRFLASHSAVVGYVFPHDTIPPARLKAWMDEVQASGIIQLYRVGQREYGVFPKWASHQKINRPQASSLPSPPTQGVTQ